MKKLKLKLPTPVTDFIQVFFINCNTFAIRENSLTMIIYFNFMISFLWTINVSKIALSSTLDKIYYAAGATIGGACSYILFNLI